MDEQEILRTLVREGLKGYIGEISPETRARAEEVLRKAIQEACSQIGGIKWSVQFRAATKASNQLKSSKGKKS